MLGDRASNNAAFSKNGQVDVIDSTGVTYPYQARKNIDLTFKAGANGTVTLSGSLDVTVAGSD